MSCLLYDLVFWRTIPSNVEGLMRVKAANCFRSRKIFWGLILGRLIWFCLKSSLPPRCIPRELLEFDKSITPKNKLYQRPFCVIGCHSGRHYWQEVKLFACKQMIWPLVSSVGRCSKNAKRPPAEFIFRGRRCRPLMGSHFVVSPITVMTGKNDKNIQLCLVSYIAKVIWVDNGWQ